MSSAQKTYPKIEALQQTPAEACYDFYRCHKCLTLITREQEILRKPTGQICPCGSQKFFPSWPVGFDWLRPSVVKMVLKFILARVVAPRFGASVIEKML